MGRAINHEKDINKLKGEMKELQDVVAELSRSLVSTKQVHHLDDGTNKRKKTTKIEKNNAEA